MSAHAQVRDDMVQRFRDKEIPLVESSTSSGGVTTGVAAQIAGILIENPGIDTVYFFSDFRDGSDTAAIDQLQDALDGRRLYLGTVERHPGDVLVRVAESLDGGLVEMTAPEAP